MIPEVLLEKERQFRKAVERHQYGDLPRLLEDMRRVAGECRDPELAKRMRASIEWARLMVTTQRQIWANESSRLPMVNRYLDRSQESHPAVCLDL